MCSDNWAIEVLPGEDPAVNLPVHMVLIRDVGLTLGEMFDLEELATDSRPTACGSASSAPHHSR